MKIFDNLLEVESFTLLNTPLATFVSCFFRGSLKTSVNDGLQENLGSWERVFAEDSFAYGCFAVYRKSHLLTEGPCLP